MNEHTDTDIDGWRRIYASDTSDRPDLARFGPAWPLAYISVASPTRAVEDATVLNSLDPATPRVTLADDTEGRLRFTIGVAERSLSLGQVLPAMQSLGLEVLSEQPFHVPRPDGVNCWLYDFVLEPLGRESVDHSARRRIEEAFLVLWAGAAETDPFNRLVTSQAALSWREASVMRAYGQYLHQLRTPWGRTFTAAVLADYGAITRQLTDLFHARFSPSQASGQSADTAQAELHAAIGAAVDEVENLTADRVLRGYLELIRATVRTNFYLEQPADSSAAIALKFAPREVSLVPEPRPRYEVFVSSPRLEGVHLRFGEVARGGLRWSDRYEDLRTEVLGLATAQVAKNAVIIPTGAKGGFVVKRSSGIKAAPTHADGLRCYREFISALLDVHDNLDPDTGKAIHAEGTVAYEGGDTYLVVAADKGTATFSDTANEIAVRHGFWLGDAFASGGSAGYDHKAMGITAKGAWASVRRHFRELGVDPDLDTFTAVGIGDMSGRIRQRHAAEPQTAVGGCLRPPAHLS